MLHVLPYVRDHDRSLADRGGRGHFPRHSPPDDRNSQSCLSRTSGSSARCEIVCQGVRANSRWYQRGNFNLRTSNTYSRRRADTESMAPARSSLAPWKIRCVQAFIAVNLHSVIRVMDIARAANCGCTQLKLAFEESLGCTPYQYVVRRRIARAQHLMLLSNDSLCDIASECGFANASALSRLFRQIVGESPSTWRRVYAKAHSAVPGGPHTNTALD